MENKYLSANNQIIEKLIRQDKNIETIKVGTKFFI
jgi:hypothetical protein